MLFFRQERIQKRKKDRGWTQEFTFVGHAQERVRREKDRKRQREEKGRDRLRKRQKERKGWSVTYVCGIKTKKAAAAKHVYKLVYMSKNSTKRKNSQTRPETLNPCRARRYLVFNGSKPLSIAHDTFHRI